MKIKYQELLVAEQIDINELPTDIIRQIKGIKLQIALCKDLPEDNPRCLSAMAKDEKICELINAWLDDVVDDDNTPPVKVTQRVAQPKVVETKAQAVAQPVVAKAEPVKVVETPAQTVVVPASPVPNNDEAIIAKIKENLKGKRIHERELTTILGSKPNQPYHKLNGMTLKRVFLGDGQYEVC